MNSQDFSSHFSDLLEQKQMRALQSLTTSEIASQERKISQCVASFDLIAANLQFSKNALSENFRKLHKRSKNFPRLFFTGILYDPQKEVKIPALLPLDTGKAVAFVMDKTMQNEASIWMQKIAVRVLSSLHGGLCRLHLVDAIGLGEHFSLLQDLSDKITGGSIVCDDRGIEDLLTSLTAHVQQVGQKYLKSNYRSLQEYNAAATDQIQPYEILFLYGFPNGVASQFRFDLVQKLILSGAKAGVYVILVIDAGSDFPHFMDKHKFFQNVIYIKEKNGLWQIKNSVISDLPDKKGWLFKPDITLNTDLAPVIDKINSAVEKQSQILIRQEDIFTALPEQQELVESDLVCVPFGMVGKTEKAELKISVSHKEGGKHTLLLGTTGVGKSALLHALILSAAWRYSPDDLEFYLFDFGQGTGFNIYRSLPHMKMLFISSELPLGLPMLEKIIDEMKRRGKLFRQNKVDDLVTYRKKTGQKLPTILVVIDEFQALVDSGTVGRRGSKIFDKIATEGRKFGIFMILSTQTLDDVNISAQANNNISTRLALQLGSSLADPRRMLGEAYSDWIKQLGKEGEGFLVQNVGYSEPIHFHALYIDNKRRIDMVSVLEKTYSGKKDAFVFDGTIPASVKENKKIMQKGHNKSHEPSAIYLGVPVVPSNDHIALRLEKVPGSNVLFLGESDEALAEMILLTIVQVCNQYEKKKFFIDGRLFSEELKEALEQFMDSEKADFLWYGEDDEIESFTDEVIGSMADEEIKKVLFVWDVFSFPQLRSMGGAISPFFMKFQSLIVDAPDKNLHTFLHIKHAAQWEQTALNMVDNFHFQNRIYMANHGGRLYDFDEEDRAMIVSPLYKQEVSPIDSAVLQGAIFQVYMDMSSRLLKRVQK